MSEPVVTYESADRIATITLNRPDKMNAINPAVTDGLAEAWARFNGSGERVAILAAAGPNFSAGADINDLPTELWKAVPGAGVFVEKPVIAAVRGWCIGGGLALVQNLDLCVAAETAQFYYPEGKVGISGGLIAGLVTRLPHKIAMEVMLLGQPLSAQRAYEVGFVNRVVPEGEELKVARELAGVIAGYAPLVMKALKRHVHNTLAGSPSELAARYQAITQEMRQSADLEEGLASFREKREPSFTGR